MGTRISLNTVQVDRTLLMYNTISSCKLLYNHSPNCWTTQFPAVNYCTTNLPTAVHLLAQCTAAVQHKFQCITSVQRQYNCFKTAWKLLYNVQCSMFLYKSCTTQLPALNWCTTAVQYSFQQYTCKTCSVYMQCTAFCKNILVRGCTYSA